MSELKNAIDQVLADWTELAISKLHESLEKKKLNLTDELKNSIKFEVQQATEEGRAMAILRLRDYGRHRDMKVLHYTKPANVDALTEWVKKLGVGKFKFVPGYDPRKRKVTRMPVTNLAVRRIAWGVAISRLKRSPKRKQWFNKTLYGPLIGQLIESLIEAVGTSSIQVIERELEAVAK